MEDDKVLAAVTEKLQQASSGTAQMAFEMQQCFKEVSTSIQQICHVGKYSNVFNIALPISSRSTTIQW
jgi:hypothetical protein